MSDLLNGWSGAVIGWIAGVPVAVAIGWAAQRYGRGDSYVCRDGRTIAERRASR